MSSTDVTADQRRVEMKRLLFGLPITAQLPAINISSPERPASENEPLLSSDDQLGIPHVTDRWSQVLRETLPQCPWMAVQKQLMTEDSGISGQSSEEDETVIDVRSVDFDTLCVIGQVISSSQHGGIQEGTEVTLPLEDITVSAAYNDLSDEVVKNCAKVLDYLMFFKRHLYMSWDDPTQGLGVTEDGTDIEGLCRSLPPNSPQQRYIERLVRLGWLTLEVDDTGNPSSESFDRDWMEVHFDNRYEVFEDFRLGKNTVYLKMKQMSAEFEGLKKELANLDAVVLNESPKLASAAANKCEKILDDMTKLKYDAVTLENSQWREAAAVGVKRELMLTRQPEFGANVILVWNGGSAQSLSQAMKDLESCLDGFHSPAKTNVMFASDLTGAMERALPGDVIALPAGVHSVYAGLHLAEVTILGLTSGKDQSEEETTVSVRTYDDDGAAGYYVIVESGVVLKNLNINNETELPQVGGVLVKGSLVMKSCHLSNFDVCLKVMPGALLDLSGESVIMGRSSALVAEEKSIVIAADVQFSDCGVVIKDKDRNGINMKRINGEFSLSLASEETRIKSSGDFSLFKDNCDKKEPMEKSDHEGSCEPDLKRAKPFDV